jgi:hypothetical protein
MKTVIVAEKKSVAEDLVKALLSPFLDRAGDFRTNLEVPR